jgi:hypothetical protein
MTRKVLIVGEISAPGSLLRSGTDTAFFLQEMRRIGNDEENRHPCRVVQILETPQML